MCNRTVTQSCYLIRVYEVFIRTPFLSMQATVELLLVALCKRIKDAEGPPDLSHPRPPNAGPGASRDQCHYGGLTSSRPISFRKTRFSSDLILVPSGPEKTASYCKAIKELIHPIDSF